MCRSSVDLMILGVVASGLSVQADEWKQLDFRSFLPVQNFLAQENQHCLKPIISAFLYHHGKWAEQRGNKIRGINKRPGSFLLPVCQQTGKRKGGHGSVFPDKKAKNTDNEYQYGYQRNQVG